MSIAKQLILLVCMLWCSTAINGQTETKNASLDIIDSIQKNYITPTHHPLVDSLLNFSKQFLNKPYNYRVNPTTKFDCSGFASYIYSNFGYSLKRSSYEQAKQLDTIHRDQLKSGDLVFFSGRKNNQQVGHVGIVVNVTENGKFEFIHASNHSGIVISKSEETYYARRFIKAGRVIHDNTY